MARYDNYLFRCSALGKIVSKSGKFTETTKSYLQELFIEDIYGVRKQIHSKYFEKGLFEEESGITLLNETLYKGKLILKNKTRKSNEFIQGECDCVAPDGIVYDIKNAWDRFTFGNAELSHDYYWQLVGYMWLWELNQGRLFYCLNNTPEHLLCAEERKLFYSGNYLTFEDKDYINDCEKLRKAHNYNAMPLEDRFKVWDVLKSEDDVLKLMGSVLMARNYMNELYEEHIKHIERNKAMMDPSIFMATPIDEGMIVSSS
jgi:hypothetical protein